MKQILAIIIGLLTSSCGTLLGLEPRVYNTEIDSELRPYVESFLTSCAFNGVGDICNNNISHLIFISFVDQIGDGNSATIGQCEAYSSGGKFIKGNVVILRAAWETLDEYAKTILVFHELEHCILYVNHLDSRPHVMNSFLYRPYSDFETRNLINESFDSFKSREVERNYRLTNDDCVVTKELEDLK